MLLRKSLTTQHVGIPSQPKIQALQMKDTSLFPLNLTPTSSLPGMQLVTNARRIQGPPSSRCHLPGHIMLASVSTPGGFLQKSMGPRTTVPDISRGESLEVSYFYSLLLKGRGTLWDPVTLRVYARRSPSHCRLCMTTSNLIPRGQPEGKGPLSSPESPFHLLFMVPASGCGR